MVDKMDIFDTPQLRYDKFRKEYDRKYLNPKAWDYEFNSKELVQAYHDLLQFLEGTESFGELDESLRTDIPVDNVHLVLDDLPLPLDQREELITHMVAGIPRKSPKPSHEDQVCMIKEFCKWKKERGLFDMEIKSGIEIMHYRRALREGRYEDFEKFFEDVKKPVEVKKPLNINARDAVWYNERKIRENEILEIRQKVYS